MMKRTLDQQYAASDNAHGIHRQILGPQGDLDEIYYQTGSTADAEENVSSIANSLDPQKLPVSQPALPSPPIPDAMSDKPLEELPDVEVAISAILLSILAPKLRKSPTDIQLDKTINNLVGGKPSTNPDL